jgi:ABC-type molybdate transport system substrate-binding protein
MLAGAGLWDAVARNRKLDAATGDFLVNQLRAGSLDAVVVYRSNAMSNPANLAEHLDIVDVDSPGSVAVQPMGIALDAKYPLMMRRFRDAVLSSASRDQFLSYGFRWIAETQ